MWQSDQTLTLYTSGNHTVLKHLIKPNTMPLITGHEYALKSTVFSDFHNELFNERNCNQGLKPRTDRS